MNTDYELLVLAAKAVGIPIELIAKDGRQFLNDDALNSFRAWNPLTDDGDALRLAMAVALQIIPGEFDVHVVEYSTGTNTTERWDEHDGDRPTATRRAIVRAAAELGRAA